MTCMDLCRLGKGMGLHGSEGVVTVQRVIEPFCAVTVLWCICAGLQACVT